MSTEHFDVIVVGLGGMGSAAAYHLARRGKRVLGLDRYTPPHTEGSSHGASRIIRLAYFEDPAYVPLLRRAYALWQELERDSGQKILHVTGGLMIGPPDSETVRGSLRSAQEHDLPHELLNAAAIRQRFPPFAVDDNMVALYEGISGVLVPENAVTAHIRLAQKHGAELHYDEPVEAWNAGDDAEGVTVRTASATYHADRLVIAPGAWVGTLLPDLALPIEVERQIMYWLEPPGGVEAFHAERFPIYIWEDPDGTQFYGFPVTEPGERSVKTAFHTDGQPTTVEAVDRTVHPEEIEALRRHVRKHIPSLDGPCTDAITCMYVNTPDQHFVIASHPEHPQVSVAVGLCGHGFKFATVVGEILADLTINGTTPHPIELFSPQRLMGKRYGG
jgi:sarcosine oxidase